MPGVARGGKSFYFEKQNLIFDKKTCEPKLLPWFSFVSSKKLSPFGPWINMSEDNFYIDLS